jgi:starch-binding outer membrane protein, SusD/RagB family
MLRFNVMKVMKTFISLIRKITTILFFVIMTLPFACDDFLDKPLQGELTQETFPTNSGDALLATNAIYNTLRLSSYNSGLFPIMDIMSDDAYKGSNPDDAASTVGLYNNFTHIPTEGNIGRWWNTLYEGIKRANVVIEKVPEINMNETLRNRYVGEARFLRALFYLDLVRAWGGVPIVTSIDPAIDLTRASKEAVFDLIKQDLLFAAEFLPEKSQYTGNDAGRATKGAAKALLARAFLFQNDFINAQLYALEVIESGQYNLEANFEDANSVNGEHGMESVFEIGAIGFESLANGGNQYANVQGVRGNPNRGWGFNRPSLELMASFEVNDPRLDATVIFLGEVLDGVTIVGDGLTPNETYNAQDELIEIECYNQKVWTPGNNVQTQFAHNRRLIRYADVLLMAAEALNENNNPGAALIHLNRVRERARGGDPAVLPDIVETGKDALRDLILRERRHELALEGHRYWDLVRTGRALEVLGPLGFVQGKHELLPIPQTEVDLSQRRIIQNPNWD